MTREFIYTRPFLLSWEKMGLDDKDLKQLEIILLRNPLSGDVIQGTKTSHSVRRARQTKRRKSDLFRRFREGEIIFAFGIS